MIELNYEDLAFKEEGNRIKATLYKYFYCYLDKDKISAIGDFEINRKGIMIKADEKKLFRFNALLSEAMKDLRNSVTGCKAVYIHKNSNIPLIGSNSFGLVDRNSNVIEIKPITGCNQNCIFCSVGEGISTKKEVDYVVEKDYLIQEFAKLAEFKNCDIEAHINSQGEPTLYAPLVELVRDLSAIKQVKVISMNTNGALLTEHLIDELIEAGLTRFNLSLNAIDKKTAIKLAGCNYDVEHTLDIARYIAKKKHLLIAPVLVDGVNNTELEKLVKFAKELNVPIGIQNFLSYKQGRNPAKQLDWDLFKSMLKELEAKYTVHLLKTELTGNFMFAATKKLPKPFRKGDVIKAQVVMPGRFHNEMVAAANGRSILIQNCHLPIGATIKAKILRSKHNVFVGRI